MVSCSRSFCHSVSHSHFNFGKSHLRFFLLLCREAVLYIYCVYGVNANEKIDTFKNAIADAMGWSVLNLKLLISYLGKRNERKEKERNRQKQQTRASEIHPNRKLLVDFWMMPHISSSSSQRNRQQQLFFVALVYSRVCVLSKHCAFVKCFFFFLSFKKV